MTIHRSLSIKREKFVALLLALPALTGLLLFIALPFILAIGLSITNLRLGSPLPLEIVGLREYIRIFSDSSFLRALANNVLFAVAVVPMQTALALGLALLLNQKLRGISLFRTMFFMPVVFPMSLVAVVWVMIYAPGPNGMMNSFLSIISLGTWQPQDFLHNPLFAMPAIMLTSIWQGVGFQMVILLAGLQGISTTLYEAAEIDGAGTWQRFKYITIPQLRNPLIFVVVVTSILAFRLFDQVRIMTLGGPRDSTTTVIFEAVKAGFDQAHVARGAAMTVIFFLIVLTITLLQRVLLKQTYQNV